MKANGSFHWNCILKQMLSLGTVFAIVLAGAPGAAFAQAKSTSPQKAATAAGPAAAARSTKASAPGGGPQEGIKVHGEWTIEVRNPDGTVAARREFQNAYLAGSVILPRLLGRQISPGPWVVTLGDSTGSNPQACATATKNDRCGLYEGASGVVLSGVATASTTLSVSVVAVGQRRLLLSGSFTASAAANINEASTSLTTCPATTAPATSCSPQGAPILSFSTTAQGAFQPVSVVPGQIVQVTVAFSFL